MDAEDTMPTAPRALLTGEQRQRVRAIIDAVVPGAQVRVFGSRSTGRARPYSDLDLLLVSPSRLDWITRAELRDRFEASELPFRVDLVDAEGLSPSLRGRVQAEAQPL